MSWTQRSRADIGVPAFTGGTILVADSPAIARATYSATSTVACVVEDLNAIVALKGVTGSMIQQAAGAVITGSLSTFAQTFPSNNGAGNTLVAAITMAPNGFGPVPLQVTDTLGNTWTQVFNILLLGGLTQLAVFVATGSLAGANTVTFTSTRSCPNAFSCAFTAPCMSILEYPGGSGVDTAASAGSATGGALTISLTTAQPGETLLNIVGLGPGCASITFSGPTGGLQPAWLIVNEPGGTYTDRTAYMHKGPGNQNSWNQELGQRGTATIHLYVAAGDTYQPVRGSQVYLFDQNERGFVGPLFSGLIEDITVQYFSNKGDHFVVLTCVSFEALLDTVYADVAVSYTNATCGSIVTDLFNRFESGAPITLGAIADGATIPLFNVSVGQKLSELYGQLATTSQFVWLVDPLTLQIFFGAPSTTPAPFTLDSSSMLWDGQIQIEWTVDGRDKRNRQAIKLSFDAFPKSKEYIVGTGQQDITLMRPVQQVTNAWATPVTPNTATAHFSGQPAVGDTVTIGPANSAWQANHLYGVDGTITINGFVQQVTTSGTTGAIQPIFSTVTGQTTVDNTAIWTCLGPSGLAPAGNASTMTYTFVAALDNTQFGQVLIGASLAATVQNLVDAINAAAPYGGTPATTGRGLTFSLPTWENSQINAITVTGTGFTAQEKSAGSGWVSMLTSTGTAFSWSNEFTTGGASPFGTIQLQVYQAGTSTAAPAVQYTPGSANIRMATPLNVGSALNIEYTRADGAVIQLEDTADVTAEAAIQKGTGKYQLLTDQSSTGLVATSAAAGLQLGQEILAAFVAAPQKLTFSTYIPGLLPGQTLPVSLDFPMVAGATPVLNGTWVIQRVEAALVPVTHGSALPWLLGPLYGHYRYTVEAVNIQEIASPLDFWKGAGGGGSGGGGAAGGLPGPGGNVPTSGGSTSNSGTALLIEVNGTALSANTAQSEVNFESGTGITLTDLGGGNLQIAASGASPTGGVKYTASWTSQTSVGVAHNLGTTAVLVQVYDGSGNQAIPQNIQIVDANNVTLTFGASFTGSVTVVGIGAIPAAAQYTTSWSAQTSVTVTHGLGTTNVFVQIRDGSGDLVTPQNIAVTSSTVVTLTFGAAFTGSVLVVALQQGVKQFNASWTAQTTVTVTHNLGTTAVIVQVYDGSGNQAIPQNIAATDANTVTLTFGAAFTGSASVIG